MFSARECVYRWSVSLSGMCYTQDSLLLLIDVCALWLSVCS